MHSITELEEAFEAVGKRSKYLKLSDLRVNDTFLIKEIKKDLTTFGARIVAQVSAGNYVQTLTLPEAYLSLTDEQLSDLQFYVGHSERYEVFLTATAVGQKTTRFRVKIKDKVHSEPDCYRPVL